MDSKNDCHSTQAADIYTGGTEEEGREIKDFTYMVFGTTVYYYYRLFKIRGNGL